MKHLHKVYWYATHGHQSKISYLCCAQWQDVREMLHVMRNVKTKCQQTDRHNWENVREMLQHVNQRL